jgi:hypothetical protein
VNTFDEKKGPRAAQKAATARAVLAALTRAVLRSYQRRPALSRTLLKEALFADEPWATRFRAQTTGTHGAIAALVEAAKARGELDPAADGALFGVAYLSFFYFALLSFVQGAHRKPAELVDHLVAQHLLGLRPPTRSRT